MIYETLQFDVTGGVAQVTLHRPDAKNALNLAMARELMDAAIRCDEDPGIRAVVLTGSNGVFSAGGDLKSFSRAGDRLPHALKELTTYLHAAVSRLARMDAPVVAAVNGAAAGAGMSLACAADIVLCGTSARFTMAYTRAGLAPDGSSTWFLPRIIGYRRTQELMLTNRTLSAEEALAWNLVTRVVPDAELAGAARALATELAAGPTVAFGSVKKLLLTSATESLETQMEREARHIAAAARSADGKEGVAAFVGKRPPSFRGA
jgi:2-(1,2-epoxy-1,2-dihydrophenyl)acetyl-CoA isomerase